MYASKNYFSLILLHLDTVSVVCEFRTHVCERSATVSHFTLLFLSSCSFFDLIPCFMISSSHGGMSQLLVVGNGLSISNGE